MKNKRATSPMFEYYLWHGYRSLKLVLVNVIRIILVLGPGNPEPCQTDLERHLPLVKNHKNL